MSVTKRVTFQRLSVHLTLQAISPTPEFEASMENALTKSTKFKKFKALNEAFQFWYVSLDCFQQGKYA